MHEHIYLIHTNIYTYIPAYPYGLNDHNGDN